MPSDAAGNNYLHMLENHAILLAPVSPHAYYSEEYIHIETHQEALMGAPDDEAA